jgi:hypothetical protein
MPTLITCFEVLEHIEPEHCRRMLQKIHSMLSLTNGTAMLSTPCYDRYTGAADNHVSEITYKAFGALLEDLDFKIEEHYGTFASQKDYAYKLRGEALELYTKLSDYYESNYLATILAPLYPQYSRNCLWHVTPLKKPRTRLFTPLIEVEGPWTSSNAWEGLNG